MNDVGALDRNRRDFSAVLALEHFGHLRLNHFGLGHQLLHGMGKVVPAVLAPGVVLLNAGDLLRIRTNLGQVSRRADVVHCRIKAGTEYVLRGFVFLEQLRRAAIVEHRHRPQLFSHRRNGQAVAGRDVPHHRIDLLTLHQVAEFLDLLGGPACLIDDHHFDFSAVDPQLVVGCRQLPFIQAFDQHLGGIGRRLTKRTGRRTGQEGHDTNAELAVFSGLHTRAQGQGQTGSSDGKCQRVFQHAFLGIIHAWFSMDE